MRPYYYRSKGGSVVDEMEKRDVTPLEKARQQVEQAKARYQALLARESTEARKLDTRRKVILGGLLLDAAGKDERFGRVVDELMQRISRDHDLKAFAGWQTPEPDRS